MQQPRIPTEHKLWLPRLSYGQQLSEKVMLKCGQLSATFIMYKDDYMSQLATPNPNSEHKQKVYDFLSILFASKEIEGFISIAEMWFHHAPKLFGESEADHRRRLLECSPSQASDRKEIVAVHAVYYTAGDERVACVRNGDIIRRGDASFEKIIWDDDIHYGLEGMLSNILPETRPSSGLVSDAKKRLEALGAETMAELGIVDIAKKPQ